MKHLLSLITLIAVAFLAVSWGKDSITPEELFKDNSKEAKVTIISKGGETENTVTTFSDVFVYRKSDIEGQSWFHGSSGGIKVGDYLVDGYLYCPLYDEYEARPW